MTQELATTSWSEVDANNNQTPPAGWPSGTMLPTDVEPTARANMGALKRFWNRVNPTYAASLSTTDSYAITPTQAIAGYGLNEVWAIRFPSANTATSPTVNISALGPVVLKKFIGGTKSALTKGDIQARDHRFYYDNANMILVDPVNNSGLGRPYFSVYLSSNQTGNQGPVPFNTVQEDSNTIWSSSNSRAIPQVPGVYRVHCQTAATFSSATTGQILNRSQILLNGSPTGGADWNATYAEAADTTGGFAMASLSRLIRLNGSTDYISINFITQATGGAIVGGIASTFLELEYIGP